MRPKTERLETNPDLNLNYLDFRRPSKLSKIFLSSRTTNFCELFLQISESGNIVYYQMVSILVVVINWMVGKKFAEFFKFRILVSKAELI